MQNVKYYAGIGSRETPAEIQKLMTTIAQKLSNMGYCLRSGGAEGADIAFEMGAKYKEIFLPWNGFNNKFQDGKSYFVPPLNLDYVNQFHPAADKLKPGAQKLMSRNTYQVLGQTLNDPVDFILCWTKDAKKVGGTAQAMRIADHLEIPIFNLAGTGLKDLSEYILRLNVLTL